MSEGPERLSAAVADRYLLDRELGQGGMANVYLAHDLKHDRDVARSRCSGRSWPPPSALSGSWPRSGSPPTIPKRLRPYCLYRRALLGDLARLAACIVTAGVRATTGEPDLRVGIIACLQTHGSLANWHPHLHLVVTDGGFRPLGATLCTEAIYDAFLGEDRGRALFDGHSYTGNALACAVALESLAAFDDNDCLARVARLEAQFGRRLELLRALSCVRDVRAFGGIAAFTLAAEAGGGYLDPARTRLARECLARDVLIRLLGDLVYSLPPYVVTEAEVDGVFDVLEEVVGGG